MTGTFVGMPAFPAAAREALADTQLRHNLAHATHTIRDKRARVVAEVEDWEELRVAGAAVKEAALRDLATHLETLERSLEAAGTVVHWARDAAEACDIVARIAREHGVDEVVTSSWARNVAVTAPRPRTSIRWRRAAGFS